MRVIYTYHKDSASGKYSDRFGDGMSRKWEHSGVIFLALRRGYPCMIKAGKRVVEHKGMYFSGALNQS